METNLENARKNLFWLIISIFSLSSLFEALFIHFLMGIALFDTGFYGFSIMGAILYPLSYLLVFRKLITGTGKPEIPAVILIIYCFFTLVFFMLGLALIAGITIRGWRDKNAYYESHPKPPVYT